MAAFYSKYSNKKCCTVILKLVLVLRVNVGDDSTTTAPELAQKVLISLIIPTFWVFKAHLLRPT